VSHAPSPLICLNKTRVTGLKSVKMDGEFVKIKKKTHTTDCVSVFYIFIAGIFLKNTTGAWKQERLEIR
jgi:hypothetical protein